jgi:hypothetical protein
MDWKAWFPRTAAKGRRFEASICFVHINKYINLDSTNYIVGLVQNTLLQGGTTKPYSRFPCFPLLCSPAMDKGSWHIAPARGMPVVGSHPLLLRGPTA